MLYLYLGSDREKARAELNKVLAKMSFARSVASAKGGKNYRIVRITDANATLDLEAALRGGGMFGEKRVVIFDGVFANPEMRTLLEGALPDLEESPEQFYILEEKPDAAARRTLEKHAEKVERFDAVKVKKESGSVFALASAQKRGDRKALWIGLMRELSADNAPEAIHGVLFWGAKQAFLSAHARDERERAAKLVAELAELPHEARRRGIELEYALERFVLTHA